MNHENSITLSGIIASEIENIVTTDKRTGQTRVAGSKFRMTSLKTVQKKDGTNFESKMSIGVTCWGKLADAVRSGFFKGSEVRVNGELKLDKWDKPDGSVVWNHKINALMVEPIADNTTYAPAVTPISPARTMPVQPAKIQMPTKQTFGIRQPQPMQQSMQQQSPQILSEDEFNDLPF